MIKKLTIIPNKDYLILLIIWLLGFILDRLWFSLDQEIPPADQAFYLNSLMDYWQLLHTPHLLDSKWWTQWLLLSSQVPPLLYITTLPLCQLFGTSFDIATLILSFYSAILLLSVYGLGCLLFNRKIAIYATFLCQVIPLFYHYRLIYNPVYPSTAIITLTLFLLTLFYFKFREKLKNTPPNKLNPIFNKINNYQTSFHNYCYLLTENLKKSEQNQINIVKYSFYALIYFSPSNQEKIALKIKFKIIFNHLKKFILDSIKDQNFKYAIFCGLALSSALLISQTSLNFLSIPILFIFWQLIINLPVERKSLFQFTLGIFLASFISIPWYKTNWIVLLFFNKKIEFNPIIVDSSIEFNLLTNWFYYLTKLPFILSWIIFLIPLISIFIYFLKNPQHIHLKFWQNLINNYQNQWLIMIFIGSYLLLSFQDTQSIINILPLLPLLSLIIVAIINQNQSKFKQYLQWGIISLTTLIMLGNLFPLPWAILSTKLSPYFQSYPINKQSWHPQAVIETIINHSPYLKNNVGFINKTENINPDNFSFYGRQNKGQILGQDLQFLANNIELEKQPFDWFLIKDDINNNFNSQSRILLEKLTDNSQFNLEKQWLLSDNSYLKLYHRQQPLVVIKPIDQSSSKVKLDEIILPEKAPPGFPIPVTYKWSGKWQDLENGTVLLTWINTSEKANYPLIPPPEKNFLQDHQIGLNRLNSIQLLPEKKEKSYQIIEHTAMLPSPGLTLGNYQLFAMYINQKTGKNYPLDLEKINLEIDLTADIISAPETDFITQLRKQAIALSRGAKELDSLLQTIMNIHQFDPMMEDIKQLEIISNYRLNSLKNEDNQTLIKEKQASPLLYSLALSQILQRDIKGAIASVKKIIKLEPKNPYASVYLASIYLYNWQINKANQALKPALEINPNLPEVKLINGVISLMQGRLFTAWKELNSLNYLPIDGQNL